MSLDPQTVRLATETPELEPFHEEVCDRWRLGVENDFLVSLLLHDHDVSPESLGECSGVALEILREELDVTSRHVSRAKRNHRAGIIGPDERVAIFPVISFQPRSDMIRISPGRNF